MYSTRYMYDALYGLVRFPKYVWETMLCPELQRLREVRLCNINSLCLPGGANISRYEHSLGTAHLALQFLQRVPTADKLTQKRIVLAALLHDIKSGAFGHSVQYVLDSRGYEHESLFDMVGPEGDTDDSHYCYQHSRLQSVYFGLPRRMHSLLDEADLRSIAEMVAGDGSYGPLISGTVDLDNIDNVYRLAYHIGLTKDTNTPMQLAASIWPHEGRLVIQHSSKELLEKWYNVRKVLYHYLLLNPDEFSAKCMLQEALETAQERSEVSFYWHDVDYELLEKLADSTTEAAAVISRLMVGDLYGCAGVYATSRVDLYERIAGNDAECRACRSRMETEMGARSRAKRDASTSRVDLYERIAGNDARCRACRHRVEFAIGDCLRAKGGAFKSASVAVHMIKDVNKTERQVCLLTSDGEEITIGTPSSRLLVGVFFRNVHLSMLKLDEQLLERFEVRKTIADVLEHAFSDPEMVEIRPYGEADEAG